MAKLACYTCSNCGAVLNVEQGHKLFDCPFCGADFDYYFFYRKDLLEQADACLRRMDFEEAKERFEDILAHEPKEFLALRGLVLCAGNIISPKNLTSPEKLEGCKFDEVRSVLTEVTDIAAEEDKAYFHKLAEMFDLAKEYIQVRDKRNKLSGDSNAEFKKIVKIDNDIEKTKSVIGGILLLIGMIIMAPFASEGTTREDLENAGMLALSVIGVGIVCAVLFTSGKFAFLVALGIVAVILGIIALARHLENKAKAPHRQKMKENQGSIGTLSARLTELETKYSEDYEELQKMVPDDTRRTKPAGKSSDYSATTEDEKQLVCNKCGGLLVLDRERRLYECRSCGVAYSTALMADTDSSQTALHLLSKKEFAEADKLFVLELLLDPNNFTALRGRILCAGRWDNVRHIKLEGPYNAAGIKAAKELVEEAIAKTTDEDKEYFLKFREVIEELERRCRFHKTVRSTYTKADSQTTIVDRTRFAQLIIELAKR